MQMIPDIFENILDDGKVQKHVLVKSTEDTEDMPVDGQTARICYKCRKSDYSIVDENTNSAEPFEFEVGSEEVIKGLNVGIRTMRVGETAVFKIHPDLAYGSTGSGKISANETIYFEASLVGFAAKERTKADLSPEERLAMAAKSKEEGSALFAAGNQDEAKRLFEKTLDLLDWEKGAEAFAMKVALRNNVALVCLNKQQWKECVVNCNSALELDKDNVKALYKKAKANRLMQEFDLATEVVQRALAVAPQDTALINELNLIRRDKRDCEEKERKMFAKVLG